MDVSELYRHIDGMEDMMIGLLSEIVSVPAVGPASGGDGEMGKARAIEARLREMDLGQIVHLDAPDPRVPGGMRPNLRLDVKGRDRNSRLVVMVHMDVVPPGDPSLWVSDPFRLVRDGDRLVGRGVEDNGQALTAVVFALKAVKDLGLEPARDVTVFFVSDEEESNELGIGHLLKEGEFRKDDLILVPDHGDPEGRVIEVMEKTLLWLKATVTGKQCHASMPHLGNNALRASMEFGSRADMELHRRFPDRDDRFDHPFSSFEPTKKGPGVDGINILPGEDSFHFDCRLLPQHSKDDVMAVIRSVAREVGDRTSTAIEIEEVLSETTSHPTSPDSPIVRLLSEAIEAVTGERPVTGGIGGGTCAAILRNAGHEVAVWETILNQAHAPNEHILIPNLLKDCKVIATLLLLAGTARPDAM